MITFSYESSSHVFNVMRWHIDTVTKPNLIFFTLEHVYMWLRAVSVYEMDRGKHSDNLLVMGLVIHYTGMVLCDVANGNITQPNYTVKILLWNNRITHACIARRKLKMHSPIIRDPLKAWATQNHLVGLVWCVWWDDWVSRERCTFVRVWNVKFLVQQTLYWQE